MKDSFVWKDASFSSFGLAFAASASYVIVILGYMASEDVRKMLYFKDAKKFVSAHNLILCFASLGMFLGCLYEVVKRSQEENSIDWLFCEHMNTVPVGALWFYSYLYYLSKYYELLDTFLQLFSGKVPPNFFLHVYHHSLVIFMSWIWIETTASMQFIGLLFNTAVHVVMYYYYYLRSRGIVPWWKNYVTSFQIVQFVTSLVSFIVTLYFVWTRRSLGADRQCKGIPTVFGSLAFNITLLYGFVNILNSSKKKLGKKSED